MMLLDVTSLLAIVVAAAPVQASQSWRPAWTVRFDLPAAETGGAPTTRIAGRLVTFLPPTESLASDTQAVPPAVAIEYGEAYRIRAKVHKIASFAILPLFAAEGYVGQSLYNSPSRGKRDAHLAVAASIGGLFAVNTVTGVWNLIEARNDPNGRGRRLLHSILMIAADAGFFATALLAPESEFDEHEFGSAASRGEGGSRAPHRAMAFTAIGSGALGYLVMLLGGH